MCLQGDFGLSKIVDEQDTMKTVCGTPGYCGEQWGCGAEGQRSSGVRGWGVGRGGSRLALLFSLPHKEPRIGDWKEMRKGGSVLCEPRLSSVPNPKQLSAELCSQEVPRRGFFLVFNPHLCFQPLKSCTAAPMALRWTCGRWASSPTSCEYLYGA